MIARARSGRARVTVPSGASLRGRLVQAEDVGEVVLAGGEAEVRRSRSRHGDEEDVARAVPRLVRPVRDSAPAGAQLLGVAPEFAEVGEPPARAEGGAARRRLIAGHVAWEGLPS